MRETTGRSIDIHRLKYLIANEFAPTERTSSKKVDGSPTSWGHSRVWFMHEVKSPSRKV